MRCGADDVRELMRAGGVRVTRQDGKTALDIAKRRGNYKVAALLREVSARAR